MHAHARTHAYHKHSCTHSNTHTHTPSHTQTRTHAHAHTSIYFFTNLTCRYCTIIKPAVFLSRLLSTHVNCRPTSKSACKTGTSWHVYFRGWLRHNILMMTCGLWRQDPEQDMDLLFLSSLSTGYLLFMQSRSRLCCLVTSLVALDLSCISGEKPAKTV